MSSNPIDQEKLRQAREWADSVDFHDLTDNRHGHRLAAAIEVVRSLPEPAPLTMDKVSWSDAEHHLAEAETPHGSQVVMLYPDEQHRLEGDPDYIVCSHGGETALWANHDLTPTGGKRKLVPAGWEGINGPFPDRQPGTTEPVEDDAPTTDQSPGETSDNRSSEVSADLKPQPGEAWLLDCYGDGIAEAIYTGIGDFPWTSFHPDVPGGNSTIYKSAAPLHRLAPVVEPRVLRTVEDYRDADVGTVVSDYLRRTPGETSLLWQKLEDGQWWKVGGSHPAYLPNSARTVIWEPGA